jgi:hypothetical protein
VIYDNDNDDGDDDVYNIEKMMLIMKITTWKRVS